MFYAIKIPMEMLFHVAFYRPKKYIDSRSPSLASVRRLNDVQYYSITMIGYESNEIFKRKWSCDCMPIAIAISIELHAINCPEQ